MLVGKEFVDGQVAVPVAEVYAFSGFFACPGGTCDRTYVYLVMKQSCGSYGQQGQLYGSGEAARIGYVVGIAHILPGLFRQAVDEMPAGIVSIQAEVVAKVDDSASAADASGVDELP